MTTLARIADLLLNTPLLLTPEKASVIAHVLSGRIGLDAGLSRFEGSPIGIDEQGMRKLLPYNVKGDTGIITITGPLVNRGAWVGASCGLTSYEGIQHQLKSALADPKVKNIILDISSPGGEAIGAFETAAMVRDVAAQKPVVAVVNGMAASAAYAIASGATEIVGTESAVSGSIGVISVHVDASQQLENDGLKPTLIIAGAHKADGHPFGALPDSVRADFQARVNGIYEQFLSTVAAGRGERLTVDAARATEARMYTGKAAKAVGLVDRIGTFESVLKDLNRGNGRSSSSKKGKPMTEENSAPAAEANAGITQAQLDAAVSNAVASAVSRANAEADARLQADRTRIAALDQLAARVAGNEPALKIVADAKANGTSAADCALALVNADAFTQAAVLNAIRGDDASASGAKPAVAADGPAATPQTPEGWRAEYAGSTKLQQEYGTETAYVAFKKAEANGQVKILGRTAV